MICSTNVEPQRGTPTTNTGTSEIEPNPGDALEERAIAHGRDVLHQLDQLAHGEGFALTVQRVGAPPVLEGLIVGPEVVPDLTQGEMNGLGVHPAQAGSRRKREQSPQICVVRIDEAPQVDQTKPGLAESGSDA